MIKNYIKSIIKKVFYNYNKFLNSSSYWENRYRLGGNSGSGSYHKLAEFKGEVINSFLEQYKVKNVIEFGCGDGNQIQYSNYSNYLGFDISKTALTICKNRYKDNLKLQFLHLSEFTNQNADLVLSLDVIYHLVENDVYENYLKTLFNASTKLVLIYSSNYNSNISESSSHVKHRNFTDWVETNIGNFQLVKTIPNIYPFNGDDTISSHSDFFLYERI